MLFAGQVPQPYTFGSDLQVTVGEPYFFVIIIQFIYTVILNSECCSELIHCWERGGAAC